MFQLYLLFRFTKMMY